LFFFFLDSFVCREVFASSLEAAAADDVSLPAIPSLLPDFAEEDAAAPVGVDNADSADAGAGKTRK
jgi:hypothetical protein